MRLTYKLALAFSVVIAVVLGFNTYFSVRWHNELYRADVLRDHRDVGRALSAEITDAVRKGGPEAAAALVDEVNTREGHVRVRWVLLDKAAPPDKRPDAPLAALEQLIQGREVVYSDGLHVYTYVPARTGDRSIGAIELSEEGNAGPAYLRSRVLRTIVMGLAMIALGAVVSFLVGRRVVGRPVQELVSKARRVGSGDFGEPIVLRGSDELSDLAGEMNSMADRVLASRRELEAQIAARIQAIEQVRRADRLATAGRLASGLAHELGTPLNVVSERAKMIGAGDVTGPEDIVDNARIIREQAQRMTAIVRQLLDFTRLRSPDTSRTDLAEFGRATLSLLQPLAERRGVSLGYVLDAPASADVDSAQLQQALTNLIVNALDATERGRKVTLRVGTGTPGTAAEPQLAPAPHAYLGVEDEGPGISETALPHLFEPFYTTKPVGEGTGLGLAVADGIVREHRGRIDVRSDAGKGSSFTIWLPRSA